MAGRAAIKKIDGSHGDTFAELSIKIDLGLDSESIRVHQAEDGARFGRDRSELILGVVLVAVHANVGE